MELSQTQIKAIIQSHQSLHSAMSRRCNYYAGIHDICLSSALDQNGNPCKSLNADGTPKNAVPDNFIRYIVESYVGALTSLPFSYTLKSDEEDVTPLEALDLIIDRNDLHTIDTEHLRTALTQGYSVEVHSFTNGEIVITQHDPREFSVVFNTDDEIIYAIRKVELQPFTYFNDTLLDKKTVIITVYDASTITTYQEIVVNGNPTFQVMGDVINHAYGRVPIVLFTINKARQSFLSNALLKQNDVYNKVASCVVDDIEYNADALLIVSGYNPEDVFDVYEAINKQRVFPLLEGGDAKFITKGNQVEKLKFALDTTREAIHRMSDVPDMKDIVGNTGQASGVAVRLRYNKMMQTGEALGKYIKQGVRKRIDLIQTIWKKLNRPTFGYYDIVITFNLPTNSIDVWQGLTYLKDITSHKTLLSLIPEIDDPESELETIRMEQSQNMAIEAPTSSVASPSLASKPNTPPKQVQARTEQIVNAKVGNTSAVLESILKQSLNPIPSSEIAAFADSIKGS